GFRDRRLAAAGFAGDPEALTGADREVDAVDGHDVAVGHGQAAQLDQRLAPELHRRLRLSHRGGHRDCLRRGLLISSMPASRNTSPTTVITRASPGKRNGHHSPWRTVEFVWAQ